MAITLLMNIGGVYQSINFVYKNILEIVAIPPVKIDVIMFGSLITQVKYFRTSLMR